MVQVWKHGMGPCMKGGQMMNQPLDIITMPYNPAGHEYQISIMSAWGVFVAAVCHERGEQLHADDWPEPWRGFVRHVPWQSEGDPDCPTYLPRQIRQAFEFGTWGSMVRAVNTLNANDWGISEPLADIALANLLRHAPADAARHLIELRDVVVRRTGIMRPVWSAGARASEAEINLDRCARVDVLPVARSAWKRVRAVEPAAQRVVRALAKRLKCREPEALAMVSA